MNITISKRNVYREIIDCVMIALGVLLYAIGWTVFLLPNNISNGGVAGLSSILYWATGIPVSVSFFVMNALLLIAALKVLGLKFCIKTIYGVILMTMITGVLRELWPNPTILHDQPLMAALMAAIFCGTGLALCLIYNGSSGGSDIVAAMVHKYRDISLGRVILFVDMSIVTLSYLVLKNWEQVIFGYFCLFVTTFVLDQIINSGRRSVQFLIISERYEEICREFTATPPHRGCTIIDAQGYYTGQRTKIILVVARQREAGILYRLVNDIDPHAFVTQSQVMGVFGEGFDKFKLKSKKSKS